MGKKLYRFEMDYGRQGSLEGLFIADEADYRRMIGKEVYFGEVLGKHSEVFDDMSEEYFEVLELPEDVVNLLEEKLGSNISGFNPVDIFLEDEEETQRALDD
jgi:hypothetical protein